MSLTVRTSQRHAVTQVVAALPTDQLRRLRSMDAFLVVALPQLHSEQGVSLQVSQRVAQSAIVSPGHRSENFHSGSEMGVFLRFIGNGNGRLHVHSVIWYPVGPIADSSWAYIPPGKYFNFEVDPGAAEGLMFEAVATAEQ